MTWPESLELLLERMPMEYTSSEGQPHSVLAWSGHAAVAVVLAVAATPGQAGPPVSTL
ncbi:MAG: hypothetical protein V3U55_05220 [Mycobacterium sp.]